MGGKSCCEGSFGLAGGAWFLGFVELKGVEDDVVCEDVMGPIEDLLEGGALICVAGQARLAICGVPC